MARDTHKQARTEEILGELAEIGLALARDLAACARASEDPGEMERLAGAFNKTSRAVRLTLALDARLDRDAERDAAAAEREARATAEERERAEAIRLSLAPKPKSAAEVHKRRVRDLMNRLLWNESEGDEEDFEVLREDLDARLDEAARSDDFEAVPVEILAQHLKADMGLAGRLVLSPIPAPKPTSNPSAANGHDRTADAHPARAGPGP